MHDPRRRLWGTGTAALVWGVCGRTGANGTGSVLVWGAVGAVGAVVCFHSRVHHLTKSERASVGSVLPAQSSALAVWLGTKNARRLLEAAAVQSPTATGVATIETDLTTHVFAGPADPVESPPGSADAHRGDSAVLSMVMLHGRVVALYRAWEEPLAGGPA